MSKKLVLDLTKLHFERQPMGGVVVMGTWMFDRKPAHPCLVLLPGTIEAFADNAKPYIIPLEHAHLWAEETGDPRDVARMSYFATECLGLNRRNIATVMRVTSLIRDHLGDLLAIPPLVEDREVVADAIITSSDGRVKHAEIIDHV